VEFIGLAAIAGCYLAIIAKYVWVFKQIQDVKKEMIEHTQKPDIHVSSERFVLEKVCDQKVLRIEGKVDNLKEIVTTEFQDIKEIIKKTNGD
jgi:hypothetical protein